MKASILQSVVLWQPLLLVLHGPIVCRALRNDRRRYHVGTFVLEIEHEGLTLEQEECTGGGSSMTGVADTVRNVAEQVLQTEVVQNNACHIGALDVMLGNRACASTLGEGNLLHVEIFGGVVDVPRGIALAVITVHQCIQFALTSETMIATLQENLRNSGLVTDVEFLTPPPSVSPTTPPPTTPSPTPGTPPQNDESTLNANAVNNGVTSPLARDRDESNWSWPVIAILAGVCVILSVLLFIVARRRRKWNRFEALEESVTKTCQELDPVDEEDDDEEFSTQDNGDSSGHDDSLHANNEDSHHAADDDEDPNGENKTAVSVDYDLELRPAWEPRQLMHNSSTSSRPLSPSSCSTALVCNANVYNNLQHL